MSAASSRALGVAIAAVLSLGSVPSATGAEGRRFALLIANHLGGEGTVPLRFARDDAEKLGGVLTELGGYRPGDVTMLIDGSAAEAAAALEEMERRIASAKAAGAHTTLLLYYSGHAKGGALRLGDTRWAMSEIRGRLSRSVADVRLGILDACQSGAITRIKGGRPGPSFLFDADDAEPARGLVLISSSSDDENSQESDQLGGSYFTHYLASGLRGDADDSGDRRVTLGEVYLYAYNKTITQTIDTRSGVQHPTYSYDLQGSGNLVLTDLTRGKSGLYFDAALEGDYLIFDHHRETVAAEVRKVAGHARRIALPPGQYTIKKRLRDHLAIADFALEEAREHVVDESQMRPVAFEDDEVKGGLQAPGLRLRFGLRLAYQSFLSQRARQDLFPPVVLLGAGGELEGVAGGTLGVEVLVGGRGGQPLALGELSLDYDFLETQVAVELIWALGDQRWAMLLGPRLTALYLRRSFPNDAVLGGYAQDHFTLSPAGVVGLRYAFDRDGHFRVEGRGRLGFLHFGVDENQALLYAEAALAVGFGW